MYSVFRILAVLPAVLASPINQIRQSDALGNRWIVKLRSSASDSLLQSTISQVTDILGNDPTYTYNFGTFKGFAIEGLGDVVSLLANVASIESIEPDSEVTTNALVTQEDSTYGLARISHREPGAGEYVYDDSAGSGTYSYIIDTVSDRLLRLLRDYDERGSSNLIGVKVLSCDGSGSNAGVLAGIDYAVNDAKSQGRITKSVANLSLGGILSPTTNAAVREAVNQGLFLAVAAGNSGAPTITASPASEPKVCTVGAIDSDDQRASFSNFGLLVDVFAPGVDVLSTWIDSPDDTNVISGTSMASPHVCGLGAYLLGLEGGSGGEGLCTRIKTLSTKGALGLLTLGPNRLAYNGNGA